jgi:hypothetical protein
MMSLRCDCLQPSSKSNRRKHLYVCILDKRMEKTKKWLLEFQKMFNVKLETAIKGVNIDFEC